ncbi:hypothetical protein JTB14_010035 [Gonioctena quinquepunctata]|nr:hypothetical protein JTB14_010035 [Gonioctena quinquepunctata]
MSSGQRINKLLITYPQPPPLVRTVVFAVTNGEKKGEFRQNYTSQCHYDRRAFTAGCPGLDIGKKFQRSSASKKQQASLSSPRSSDSPDVKNNQERLEGTPHQAPPTTSSAGASPGICKVFPPTAAIQQGNGGVNFPLSQYAGQYPSQSPREKSLDGR